MDTVVEENIQRWKAKVVVEGQGSRYKCISSLSVKELFQSHKVSEIFTKA